VSGARSTRPVDINQSGQIVGRYQEVNWKSHLFLRNKDGTFITFDPPGATRGAGANAISPTGHVVGYYGNDEGSHAFLREPDGTFHKIDPLGSFNALANDINVAGQTAGYYEKWSNDGRVMANGFLRHRNGTVVSLDGPYNPTAINPAGDVAGSFGYPEVSFLRKKDGTIVFFGVPSAIHTSTRAMSETGRITGFYMDNNYRTHGFVRDADGSLTSFNVGANGTYPTCINAAGEIAGWYLDAQWVTRAFFRAKDGTILSIDPVGSQLTQATAIGPRGEVVGWYMDPQAEHGFIWRRKPGGQ
jgi:uncharacterized membrane protein